LDDLVVAFATRSRRNGFGEFVHADFFREGGDVEVVLGGIVVEAVEDKVATGVEVGAGDVVGGVVSGEFGGLEVLESNRSNIFADEIDGKFIVHEKTHVKAGTASLATSIVAEPDRGIVSIAIEFEWTLHALAGLVEDSVVGVILSEGAADTKWTAVELVKMEIIAITSCGCSGIKSTSLEIAVWRKVRGWRRNCIKGPYKIFGDSKIEPEFCACSIVVGNGSFGEIWICVSNNSEIKNIINVNCFV